ncbi:MAG: hypothetical protein A2176_04560 [Spirochaetes bacterium RBG_13_51_14]|nr:MAG: hypothetical protein A2176_04560 [Spirochaetes bacterium RBG_13_51_14]
MLPDADVPQESEKRSKKEIYLGTFIRISTDVSAPNGRLYLIRVAINLQEIFTSIAGEGAVPKAPPEGDLFVLVRLEKPPFGGVGGNFFDRAFTDNRPL